MKKEGGRGEVKESFQMARGRRKKKRRVSVFQLGGKKKRGGERGVKEMLLPRTVERGKRKKKGMTRHQVRTFLIKVPIHEEKEKREKRGRGGKRETRGEKKRNTTLNRNLPWEMGEGKKREKREKGGKGGEVSFSVRKLRHRGKKEKKGGKKRGLRPRLLLPQK